MYPIAIRANSTNKKRGRERKKCEVRYIHKRYIHKKKHSAWVFRCTLLSITREKKREE